MSYTTSVPRPDKAGNRQRNSNFQSNFEGSFDSGQRETRPLTDFVTKVLTLSVSIMFFGGRNHPAQTSNVGVHVDEERGGRKFADALNLNQKRGLKQCFNPRFSKEAREWLVTTNVGR